jgi:hypothetical protein
MLQPGAGATPERRDDGAHSFVPDEPVAVARLDKPIGNLTSVELAAGDELEQTERGEIQRDIPGASRGRREDGGLTVQRGPPVGAG